MSTDPDTDPYSGAYARAHEGFTVFYSAVDGSFGSHKWFATREEAHEYAQLILDQYNQNNVVVRVVTHQGRFDK